MVTSGQLERLEARWDWRLEHSFMYAWKTGREAMKSHPQQTLSPPELLLWPLAVVYQTGSLNIIRVWNLSQCHFHLYHQVLKPAQTQEQETGCPSQGGRKTNRAHTSLHFPTGCREDIQTENAMLFSGNPQTVSRKPSCNEDPREMASLPICFQHSYSKQPSKLQFIERSMFDCLVFFSPWGEKSQR